VTLNPAVVPYLQFWPLPGAGARDLRDGTAREAVGLKQPTDENFYQIRVDHQLSTSDSLFGRFTRQISGRSRPEAITQWSHRNFTYNTYSTFEEKKIFSPKLLNIFSFGFGRQGTGEQSLESPATDERLQFVPRSAWRFPLGAPPILGSINVSGVTGIGLGRGWVNRLINRFQYIDDMVYNSGAHSLKFGINWQRLQYNSDNPSRPAGDFTFASIVDFLAGQPSQFRGDILPSTDSVRGIRYSIIGWYVQEDWKAHPRLTLNLGFRHEFYTVPTEVNGKIGNLRNPLTDATIAIGDPWFKNPSLKSFMPRVGLAYDPTGSGKTAVRAGFGIFYSQLYPDVFEQAAFRTAPFGLETNIRGIGTIPFPGIYQAVVREGLGQADLHLFPFDYARNPHMIQWNMNIQRQILGQTAVTVAYSGSRGINLLKRVQLNTAKADVINGRYVFASNARRPNSAWSLALTSREMSANSYYHGLQVGIQRRMQRGFQIQGSYTYARTIDDASQINNDFASAGPEIAYYWDPGMSQSLAQFDVRHVFTAASVWELPFGSGKAFGSNWKGLVEHILGGWQAGGILSLASGPPVSVSVQTRTDLSPLGLAQDSPDLAPGASNNPVLSNPDRYFDTSAFLFPAARTIGNLGRDTLIASGIANFDFSLSKNARLSERVAAQFRAELFNVLNRANLDIPARQVFDSRGRRSGNAGFISRTTTTARQLQFGLKLVF
jgi:hypothetical protein